MDFRGFLLALTFAGVARCMILEPPANTAVKLGDKAMLKCQVSTEDQHLAYWAAERVVDDSYKQIYYSVSGSMVPWVEEVEGSAYDMVVTDGSYNKSGRYKCDYLAADIFSVTAELMTVGNMDCGEPGIVHREGANVGFTCSVQLTGALTPSLAWYQGDREVRGGRYIEHILEEGEEEPPAWAPRKVVFYQNITVGHTADGEEFSCRLRFTEGTANNPDPPTYTDSCTTTIGVTYGATSIEISPNPSDWSGPRTPDGVMELNVGDKFTCSARGNPPPMIIWYKIENGMGISLPEGADLVITEEMRGLNQYNCTALNEPHGQEKRAYRAIKFQVGGYTVESGESKGNSGNAVISAISVMLSGLLLVLGLLDYHKH